MEGRENATSGLLFKSRISEVSEGLPMPSENNHFRFACQTTSGCEFAYTQVLTIRVDNVSGKYVRITIH